MPRAGLGVTDIRGMLKMNRLSFATVLMTSFALLGGCASNPDVRDMTISAPAIAAHSENTPLRENITVTEVKGGHETNPLWTSEIDNDGFKEALERSLLASLLYAPDEGAARYQLSAEILSVEQPLIGASLTVTTTVEYSLYDKERGQLVFNEWIKTPYTAEFGDAFSFDERLKMANEGSARENITQLINKLYQLKFDESGPSASVK